MSAWAVIEGGVINVRSVSPTDVGAIVNWLSTVGVIVAGGVTDQQVRDAFQTVRERLGSDVEVCPVEVRRALQ